MITTDKDRNTLGNSWWFWCSSSILDAKFPEYCVALIKDVYHGNFKEGNSDILCPHRYYIYHLLYGFCICGENLCMTPLLGTLSLCQTTHQTWTLDWQPLQSWSLTPILIDNILVQRLGVLCFIYLSLTCLIILILLDHGWSLSDLVDHPSCTSPKHVQTWPIHRTAWSMHDSRL